MAEEPLSGVSNESKHRSLHSAGICRVAADGGFIMSGGADATVRVCSAKRWPSSAPLWTVRCHDAAVSCVALNAAHGVAASGGRDGTIYLHEDATTANPRRRMLCRITGEVNAIAFNAAADRLYIAGDSVRCLQRLYSAPVQVMSIPLPIPSPIVSMELSPCESYFAIASASGSVAIVSAPARQAVEPPAECTQQSSTQAESPGAARGVTYVLGEKMLSPARKRDDVTALRMCWMRTKVAPIQTFFAVPSIEGVRVFRMEDAASGARVFRKVGVVVHATMQDYVHCTLYSLSKHLMLCLGVDSSNKLGAFKVDQQKLRSTEVNSWTGRGTVCEVSVDSATGFVYYSNTSGEIVQLKTGLHAFKTAQKPKSVTPRATAVPAAPNAEGEDASADSEGSESSSSEEAEEGDEVEETNEDDPENLTEVVDDLIRTNPDYIAADHVPRVKVPARSSGGRPKPSFIDDEADDAEEEGEDSDLGDDGGGVEDEDEDGNAEAALAEESERSAKASAQGEDVDSDGDDDNTSRVHVPRAYTLQPGATPEREGACYLAFNAVGAIRKSPDQVLVMFHDVSQPTFRLGDRRPCNTAALSPAAAAFVLLPQDDADHRHVTIYCRTFAGIGVQPDWYAVLLPGETVRSLAVGKLYVAACTSVCLRIFSMSGLELVVLSVATRDVVCVAGMGSEKAASANPGMDPIAIVTMAPNDGLRIKVLNVEADGAEILPESALPLSANAKLAWLGWSDDGHLCTVDTLGVVRMLLADWGRAWVPVFDPRHLNSSARYWVWGVTDDSLLAYRCGPEQTCPIATPELPALERVRLCLPLLRSAGDKAMLQREQYLRRYYKTNELKRNAKYYTEEIAKQDMKLDNQLMEAFTAALDDEKTSRAIDLGMRFQLRDSLEAAVRVAHSKKHKQVVDKLLMLLEHMHRAKKKKQCSLPMEGTDITDKERDRILRRLLLKEKAEQAGAPTAATTLPPSAPLNAQAAGGLGSPAMRPALPSAIAASLDNAERPSTPPPAPAEQSTSDGPSAEPILKPPSALKSARVPSAVPIRGKMEGNVAKKVDWASLPPSPSRSLPPRTVVSSPGNLPMLGALKTGLETNVAAAPQPPVRKPIPVGRPLQAKAAPTSQNEPKTQEPPVAAKLQQKTIMSAAPTEKASLIQVASSPGPSSPPPAVKLSEPRTASKTLAADESTPSRVSDKSDNRRSEEAPRVSTAHPAPAASAPPAPITAVPASGCGDPFLAKGEDGQAVDWRGMDYSPTNESNQLPPPESAAVATALRKRFRDDDEEADEAPPPPSIQLRVN